MLNIIFFFKLILLLIVVDLFRDYEYGLLVLVGKFSVDEKIFF